MIRFDNVQFAHAPGRIIFENLNFELEAGHNLSIVGPSGSGKSTLLNLLLGSLKPTRGTVRFAGRVIEGPARERMIVFQHHALLPWLTALGNVRFPLETANPPPDDVERRAREWLKKFGLEEFETYYPRELSGGMQQRLGIARALAASPKLLLLDEPFSSLDMIRRRAIFADMSDMIRRENKTAVLVTHDVAEALQFADRILILGGSQVIFSPTDRYQEEEIYALWKA